MQAKIERMQELNSERDRIYWECNKRVVEVAERYVAAHEINQGYGYPTPGHADYRWSVDGSWIHMVWEETWNYGGHDGGSFEFSAEFLWNEEALKKFETDCAIVREQKKQACLEKRRQEDLVKLKELQDKYSQGEVK